MTPRSLLTSLASGLALALGVSFAQASQTIDLVEGEPVTIQISTTQMTRLVMEGGRLRGLDVPRGELSAKADPEAGDITLSPNVLRPIQGFVISATTGKKYPIVMRPANIGIGTVVLREAQAPKSVEAPELHAVPISKAATSYDAQIGQLMVTMAKGVPQRGFQIQSQDADVPFLPGARVTLTRVYASRTLHGTVYRLRNTATSQIFLSEHQFYGPRVMAVGMDRAELAPGEETYIYVIRGVDHG